MHHNNRNSALSGSFLASALFHVPACPQAISRFSAKFGDYPVITFLNAGGGVVPISYSEPIIYVKFVLMVWYFHYRRR